jgi:molybdopterin/thiamine biosynthesis adenylyltransferase
MVEELINKRIGFNFSEEWIKKNCQLYSFTFKSKAFILQIYNDKNPLTRKLQIYTKDETLKDELPPHYFRFEDGINWLCLIDEEEHILSSYSLNEYIDLMLNQLESLLSKTNKQKQQEYVKEFLLYWRKVADISFISNVDMYITERNIATKLHLSLKTINGTSQIEKVVAYQDINIFNEHNTPKGTIRNGVYIPIINNDYLTPPFKNKSWGKKELIRILANPIENVISKESYKFLQTYKVKSNSIYIVFSLCFEGGITNTFCAQLKFNTDNHKRLIDKIRDELVEVIPLNSTQYDIQYQLERIGAKDSFIDEKVLMIGCGSVGSMLLDSLIKLGILSFFLVDSDSLESGNLLRHTAPPIVVGRPKVNALQSYVEINNPLVKMETINKKLDLIGDEYGGDFYNSFDIIFITIGSSDAQKRYNKLFSDMQITTPVIFNWLDSEGKGCHALWIRYNQKGCYNCLFYEKGEKIDSNKASYNDGSEVLIKNGCNGSFTSYGINVLLRNTSMVMEFYQHCKQQDSTKNTLISIKNEFSSLEKSLIVEPRIQTEFYEEACDVCNT